MGTLVKNSGITLIALAAVLLAPSTASAHASLVKAIPAQRTVVFTAPKQVQLWFNERLEPKFCHVTVYDATGKSMDTGDSKVAASDPKQLAVTLKPLAAGVYTVKYRVLSVDGHVVQNTYTFTVRERR